MARIIGIRWQPLATILAAIYGVFGLLAFVYFEVGKEPSLTVPIGFVMPLLNFSFNLHLPREEALVFEFLLGLGSLIGYAVSGWITGAVVGCAFNFVAPRFGGVEAKWVIAEGARVPEDSVQLNDMGADSQSGER